MALSYHIVINFSGTFNIFRNFKRTVLKITSYSINLLRKNNQMHVKFLDVYFVII